MTVYGTISIMKDWLHITVSTWDSDLDNCLEWGSRHVDEMIREHMTTETISNSLHPTFQFSTLPLSTWPALLSYAAMKYGCYYFRLNYVPKGYEDQAWYKQAEADMELLVKVNWKQSKVFFEVAEYGESE